MHYLGPPIHFCVHTYTSRVMFSKGWLVVAVVVAGSRLLEGLPSESLGVGRESFRCSAHGRICTSHLRMTLSSYPQ